MYIPEVLSSKIYGLYTDLKTLHATDPYIKDKIEFQKDNVNLRMWINNVLAPSLLHGDDGVRLCIDSICNERDCVLQACKFIYAYQIWDQFDDANSQEVAHDLMLQGHTGESLAKIISFILFKDVAEHIQAQAKKEISEETGLDEEEIEELVQNDKIFH